MTIKQFIAQFVSEGPSSDEWVMGASNHDQSFLWERIYLKPHKAEVIFTNCPHFGVIYKHLPESLRERQIQLDSALYGEVSSLIVFYW